MLRIERPSLASRGALLALLAAAVAFIGLKDLIGGSLPSNSIGASTVGLAMAVASVLLIAAALDLRHHKRAATLVVAALAAATGPTLAFFYAAPAASTVGPILAFSLILPLLHTSRKTLLFAAATIGLAIVDIALLDLRYRIAPPSETLMVNNATSLLAIGGVMMYILVTQHNTIRRALSRYLRLFDRLPVAAYRWSPDGALLDVNDAMVTMLGFDDRRELVNLRADAIFMDPADGARIQRSVGEGDATGTIALRRRDGAALWAQYHARAERDESGHPIAFEGVLLDQTSERRGARVRLERQQIAEALHRLNPSRDADEMAAAISAEIVASPDFRYAGFFSIEPDDALYLHGGFLAGRPMPPQRIAPSRTSARLRERAHQGPWLDTFTTPETEFGRMALDAGVTDVAFVPLTVSGDLLGVLIAGTGSGDEALLRERLSELIDFAAIASALLAPALYERRLRVETRRRVEGIIRNGDFFPVYQPLVDMRTRRVLGYEALTRFEDGTPPDAMFAAASDVGLGLELEIATITAAMSTVTRIPDNLFLDLNASPDLVLATEPLRSLVQRWGKRVVIEITEHSRVEDYALLREGIAALGDNVVLAVDDAGAGFASLRHILELRPKLVKLDRELVCDIDSDPARQALAAGMAHFAAQSQITLVAEGVETREEQRTLIGLGVWAGQGYLFGRPQPMVRRIAGRRAA
ncbi:MAG: EAL domain-containing protein [Candidatus Limnocylindria bacterium]